MATQRETKKTPPRACGIKRERDWKGKFLKAFAEEGRVGIACEIAGITRATAYRHRQQDEDFALAWSEVERQFLENLERTAYVRALEGSDRLIEFLLKSRLPDVYGDKQRIQHSGQIDSAVKVTEKTVAPAQLPAELQKQLAAIADGQRADDDDE
jgi:hypothetical protein